MRCGARLLRRLINYAAIEPMNSLLAWPALALVVGDHADRRSRLMKIRQKFHNSFTVR